MTIELFDDEWTLGTGLALAGGDWTVAACSFGFNAKLGADALCANFVFTDPSGESEDQQQSFSVGKGWEAVDGGEALVREDGQRGKIGKTTNYGRLVNSAMDATKAAGVAMPFASPRLAAGWVGTSWTLGTVSYTTQFKDEEAKERSAFVFTAYKGAGATATAVKAPGGKAAPKAPSATDIDADLLAALHALAVTHAADHDAFVEAAYEIDGVDGVKHVEKAILKSAAGSIWASGAAG